MKNQIAESLVINIMVAIEGYTLRGFNGEIISFPTRDQILTVIRPLVSRALEGSEGERDQMRAAVQFELDNLRKVVEGLEGAI